MGIQLLLLSFYISATTPVRNLEGMGLSLETLESLKQGNVSAFAQKGVPVDHVERALFWYQELPTIGLRPTKEFFPPAYPFVPHQFTLWQLAPHRGKGVCIALIDSGISAYEIAGSAQYRKNIDLPEQPVFNQPLNMMDPGMEQLRVLLKPYTGSLADTQLSTLITQYLATRNRTLVDQFQNPTHDAALCNRGHSPSSAAKLLHV